MVRKASTSSSPGCCGQSGAELARSRFKSLSRLAIGLVLRHTLLQSMSLAFPDAFRPRILGCCPNDTLTARPRSLSRHRPQTVKANNVKRAQTSCTAMLVYCCMPTNGARVGNNISGMLMPNEPQPKREEQHEKQTQEKGHLSARLRVSDSHTKNVLC